MGGKDDPVAQEALRKAQKEVAERMSREAQERNKKK